MIPTIDLSPGQKIYFASDFHLGVPDRKRSREREDRIVQWLNQISLDAKAIFLVGDLFDFWFEYRNAIPKGYIRIQGKLAELADKGIKIYFFTGNHDMWMFSYFEEELNIPVLKDPISISISNKKFFIGHGDGLGPGDHLYKFWKMIFRNRVCQFLFGIIHPDIGIGIANFFSKRSRLANHSKDEQDLGDKEWLYQFCLEKENSEHHDFYIFGHRHLPMDRMVGKNSRYVNLGEWVNYTTYAMYDGNELVLKTFSNQ